jgi:FlaA1/EpsC-like NDP-sugar epimerase
MINSEIKRAEILITGGTGSLGKTLISQLLTDWNPVGIRIYSRDEFKQWELKQIIEKDFPGAPVSFLIGDVRDKNRLSRAMNGVNIVINAAAMKQVPACEYNPIEAIKTNIDGAINIIDAAIDNKVHKVMHISTDKAVYPVNLYGATKTVAEKLFMQANVYSPGRTLFSCCRYGNVIASRGSIIPLILEQAKTGEVTLTHEAMSRFFIHLPKVADFIIDHLTKMEGGEIFISKMPSIRIVNLIKALAPEAKIKVTGIRPGEKLHEILITYEESEFTEAFPWHFVIRKDPVSVSVSENRWKYSSDNNSWTYSDSESISNYISTGEFEPWAGVEKEE